VDATNAIIQETKIVFKRITNPNVFVENEQWSVICMKEDFHPRFATILQIIYQREQVGYFSNLIALREIMSLATRPMQLKNVL